MDKDILDQIAKLDADAATILDPAPVVMNKAKFSAYYTDQIAKAKKEAEDEEGAKKAKKRLDALAKATEVAKAADDWAGGNGTAAIPVYEGGYESDLTVRAEQSDKTVTMESLGQGDGAGVFANGAQTFKALSDGLKDIGALATPAAKAKDDEDEKKKADAKKADESFAWPSDVNSPSFMKEGIAKRAEQWGLDNAKSDT